MSGLSGLSGLTGISGVAGGASVPPTITSEDTASVVEGNTTVATVAASGGETPYVFSISGGADSSLFNIDSSSGALTFASAPDYAAPGDANGDNDYIVTVRVASAGGAYVEQTITVSVTPAYAARYVSTRSYQDTSAATPAGVGDPVRRVNRAGTLTDNAVAPNDGARPTRSANGWTFGSGKYFELGTSALLQPSTLRVSFTITRTGDMSGIYPCIVWCKPNGNFSGNGWYLEFRGPDSRIEFWGDGFGNTTINTTINTIFPLNTPTTFLLTFDPSRTPKTIITIGGSVQTLNAQNASSITSTSDTKYFGLNSPGYGSGYIQNADIEDLIIDSVIP